jgi:hypothetical protein
VAVREDQIKPIMPRYTKIYPEISHDDDNSGLDSEPSDNDEYDKSDHKFHRFLITRRNGKTGTTTYELSLFGVMLVLSLLMYNYMGTMKNGLYRDDLSPDIIVLNYSDKLPLIFRRSRWNLLKRKLKQLAFYNFAVIFDKISSLNLFMNHILLLVNKNSMIVLTKLRNMEKSSLLNFVMNFILNTLNIKKK